MKATTVQLGAFAPPLREQFPTLSAKDAKVLTAHDEAVSRLFLNDLLTRGEMRKCRQRLVRLIAKKVAG